MFARYRFDQDNRLVLGIQVKFAPFSFDNRDHEHYPRGTPPPEVSLSEMLRDYAAPMVGLDKVREIKSEGRRVLLYICTICRVRNREYRIEDSEGTAKIAPSMFSEILTKSP